MQNFKQKGFINVRSIGIIVAIISIIFFITGLVKFYDLNSQWEELKLDITGKIEKIELLGSTSKIPTPVALFETTLASSITSTATSMTLTSATDKDGNALASSTYAFIIDEGTASEEFVIADCTSTACTNMNRGISVVTGTSTVSSLRKSHRRGASVKITDGPQLMILTRIINGVDTFPNKLTYQSAPTFTVGSNELASVKYADDLSYAGTPNSTESAKGIVELATQLEMASSTSLGSTLASLVLQSKNATSTPSGDSYSGLMTPITKNNGKLSQLFWDLSEAFTTTGNWIFNGLFTANATSTMATTTVTSLTASANSVSPIILNGIDYAFPSTESASSTVLMTDGSGSLSWNSVDTSIDTCSGTINVPNSGTGGNSGTLYGSCGFTVSKIDMIVDGDGADGFWTWTSGKQLIFYGIGASQSVSTSNLDWDTGVDTTTVLGIGTATSTGFSMTYTHNATYGGDTATVNWIGTK